MLKKERRNYILARVRRDGRITTKELVEELGLAEDTIRKDFQDLSKPTRQMHSLRQRFCRKSMLCRQRLPAGRAGRNMWISMSALPGTPV